MWAARYSCGPASGFISSKLQSKSIDAVPLAIKVFSCSAEIKVVYMEAPLQCSSAGALGSERWRSTVAAMPLQTISAIPAQPEASIRSPNSSTL